MGKEQKEQRGIKEKKKKRNETKQIRERQKQM